MLTFAPKPSGHWEPMVYVGARLALRPGRPADEEPGDRQGSAEASRLHLRRRPVNVHKVEVKRRPSMSWLGGEVGEEVPECGGR